MFLVEIRKERKMGDQSGQLYSYNRDQVHKSVKKKKIRRTFICHGWFPRLSHVLMMAGCSILDRRYREKSPLLNILFNYYKQVYDWV